VEGSQSTSVASGALEPLPYHRALRDYLRTEERAVWDWYASAKVREDQAEAVRFDLLKSTYRLDREGSGDLYAAVDEAAAKLVINDVPVTLYQAQNPQGLNLSLAWLVSEAHIVLHGDVAGMLTTEELRAVFGHELSHLMLWRGWNGEYLIVDQVLAAITNDAHAQPAHLHSARLFSLYNEIFCDRGALRVAGDLHVVVSALVKTETGLSRVSAESYLRQAEEIFAKGSAQAEGITHPEAFIRARAAKLWRENDAGVDARVAEMIEGSPTLGTLDLVARTRVSALTRRLIDALLAQRVLQCEPLLAHARLFFEDYAPPNEAPDVAALAKELATSDKELRDYWCYVLLDFATADRDLEDVPLAAALALAEQLGFKEPLAEIARRELRLRKKQLEAIDERKQVIIDQPHETADER
jgi:hypothetical protein